MKISMWTAFLVEESPESAIEILASCGYRYAEFSDEHGKVLMERPNPRKSAVELASLAADRGLTMAQAHLHLQADIVAPDLKTRREVLDFLKKELELYHLLGVKAAVLHCGGRAAADMGWAEEEVVAVRTNSLRELCASIAGTGMKIALENLPQQQRFAVDLLRIIDLAGCPELGICFDTGHLNLVKDADPVEFIASAGEKLIALHIADNLGEADNHMFPCGRGTVKWPALMAALKNSPYPGLFNFEVPGERCPARPIQLLKLKYALELGRLMYDLPPAAS